MLHTTETIQQKLSELVTTLGLYGHCTSTGLRQLRLRLQDINCFTMADASREKLNRQLDSCISALSEDSPDFKAVKRSAERVETLAKELSDNATQSKANNAIESKAYNAIQSKARWIIRNCRKTIKELPKD